MPYKLALLLSITLLSGCAAKYIYPPSSITEEGTLRANVLSNLVLAIDPTHQGDYSWRGKPRSPSDLNTLVADLSRQNIFREVNFLGSLKLEPDLVLSDYRYLNSEFRGVHGESGGLLCPPWLPIVTLFIIPMYCNVDYHVTFVISNARNPSCSKKLIIKRNEKSIIGWVAPVYRISPNWVSVNSQTADYDYQKNYGEYAVAQVMNQAQDFTEVVNCN